MSGFHLLLGRRSSWLYAIPLVQRRLRNRFLRRHMFAVPMSDGTILCRILGRCKFYADAHDRGISPHLVMSGIWELDVTAAIVDRMKPGMTAIDVGANLGYFSVLLAYLVGPSGTVIAVEPIPRTRELLEASLELNGFTDRVTTYPTLVAERTGETIDLRIPLHHPGGGQATSAPLAGDEVLQATTQRLDEVPGALDATLVKIDTEGMEERVWNGMTAMIAGDRLRYVLVEFTASSYSDAEGLLHRFIAAGFAITRLNERGKDERIAIGDVMQGPHQQMLLLER